MRTLFSTWFGLLGLRRGHPPDSLPHFNTVRQVYQPSSGIGKPLCSSLLGRKVAFIRGVLPRTQPVEDESEPDPAEKDHGALGNAREEAAPPCQSLEQVFDRVPATGHCVGLFPRGETSFARRTLRIESLRQRQLARLLSAYVRSALRDGSPAGGPTDGAPGGLRARQGLGQANVRTSRRSAPLWHLDTSRRVRYPASE